MERELTHWRQSFNPDYLGAYSLAPEYNDIIVTIQSVRKDVEVNDPNGKKKGCTVAYFVENVKPMILNAGSCKAIQKLAKSEFLENWSGLKIQIFRAQIKAFGEQMDALRIRPFLPKLEKPELLPNTETWNNAIEHMASNGFTIEKVEGKYKLSPENKLLLLQQSEEKKIQLKQSTEGENNE